MATLRTLLVLGRVSNLPTVWSNCLAGWLLGGGGPWGRFALLCGGATGLYLAGMFLNDAFDAAWDRQHRPGRPIPSGAITAQAVWGWGAGFLATGLALMLPLSPTVAALALLLAATIVLYNAIHKAVRWSPLLLAECRFLLYLVAAAGAEDGISGLALWCALALGAYVAGLSGLARTESGTGRAPRWPAGLLAAPVGLALLVNADGHRPASLLVSAVLAFWTMRSLWPAWRTRSPNVAASVAGLLAGIVWVDWLAIADQGRTWGWVFVGLFLSARLGQRVVPAT